MAADDAVDYRTLVTDPALLAVFLISGISALGNAAVPVALPRIGEVFGLSEPGIGLVMSAFTLAVLVAVPVVSVLADVFGRRVVVLGSLLLFGLSGLATLGVSSYPALLALRAVQGVAFAGTLPLTPTLTGDLYTGASGSAAQGMRSGLNGLASAVAPVVAGVLAVVAWQHPFALFALALPVAAVAYRYYPEPVAPRGRSEDGERLLGQLRTYWLAIWAATDETLWLLIAGGFTLFFLKGAFLTFLPVFVVAGLGAPVTAAGAVLGIYGGTRVVVSPLSGSIMLRLGRKRSIVTGTVVAAVGLGAVPFSPGVPALALATVCFAAGEAVLNPVVNDAVAAFATDDQRAGLMSGLQIPKNVALTVAPVLVGALIGATGYTAAFVASAGLAAAYAALVLVRFAPATDAFAG